MKISKLTAFYLSIFIIITAISCSKQRSEPSEEQVMSKESLKRGLEKTEEGLLKDQLQKNKSGKSKKTAGGQLDQVFLKPMELASSRMLEYMVNITYECDDFAKGRRDLLTIIAANGFLKSSRSSAEGDYPHYPYVNASFFVKTESLYKVLQEIDTLGRLKDESITVTDHTPSMVWQQIKIEREQLRLQRKTKVIKQVAAAKKTWTAREASLERSEDQLDQARYEEWKLKDKIAWTRIHLYLKGPDLPERIDVPQYQNALIGILNILLILLYGLIYLLPFVLLFLLIWFKSSAIKRFFSKKK